MFYSLYLVFLQCLSNVGNLTQYMVEDRWKNELNEDNPLGMKGEIARSYADLVRQIWSGNYSYTVPRNFKVKFAYVPLADNILYSCPS